MHKNSTPQSSFNDPLPMSPAGTVIGYANLPITKTPDWHGSIAWDVLLNGMATGLFLAAAISELAAPEIFTPVAKVAYPVSLVLLLVDLVLLVLDLGDPLRFHHMLRVFKLVSPMSVGTWSLTIFSLPLTAVATLSLLSEMGFNFEWARKVVVVVGLVPGFCSAAYKGVLLSTNAQRGWKDARWMGGYLTNSALLLGCAELLALASLMGQERAITVLRPALGILLVLNVLFLFLLFADLRTTLPRVYSPREFWRLGLLTIGGGMLTPLCLVLFGGNSPVLLAAVMLLLLGCLAIRFAIIKIPHAFSENRSG